MHIKEYLKKHNLTITEFAAKCKMAAGTLEIISNLRRPPGRKAALMISKTSGNEITPMELIFPELSGITSVQKDPRGTPKRKGDYKPFKTEDSEKST